MTKAKPSAQDAAIAELLGEDVPAATRPTRSKGKGKARVEERERRTVRAKQVTKEDVQPAPGEVKEPRVVSSADRAKAWVAEHAPLKFVERRTERFRCAACSGYGKHAIVVKDEEGQLHMLGGGCLKYTDVRIPLSAKQV